MVAILVPDSTFDTAVESLDKITLRQFQQDALRMFTSLTGYRLEDDGTITHSSVDAWSHTPSVLMWSGYVPHFYAYAIRICEEWTNREYGKSTVPTKLNDLYMTWVQSPQVVQQLQDPAWLNDEALIASHRSRLIRQSLTHYRPLWPDVNPRLATLWPINYANGTYSLRINSSDQYQVDRGNLIVPEGTPRAKMPPGYEAGLATPTASV